MCKVCISKHRQPANPQVSTTHAYRAAVAEYIPLSLPMGKPCTRTEALLVLMANVAHYEAMIAQAAQAGRYCSIMFLVSQVPPPPPPPHPPPHLPPHPPPIVIYFSHSFPQPLAHYLCSPYYGRITPTSSKLKIITSQIIVFPECGLTDANFEDRDGELVLLSIMVVKFASLARHVLALLRFFHRTEIKIKIK